MSEQTVDIEKIVADRVAEVEKKYADELKAQKEAFEKQLSEVDKQIEDAIIEATKKSEVQIEQPTERQTQETSGVETLAEKIQAKREQAKQEREKDEQAKLQAEKDARLAKYELKEQLEKVKKEEPYLADVIDEGVAEGTITSIEQLNFIFNDKLKNKLKSAYQVEKAVAESGGDIHNYLEASNIVTDEVIMRKKREETIAKKKQKYRY